MMAARMEVEKSQPEPIVKPAERSKEPDLATPAFVRRSKTVPQEPSPQPVRVRADNLDYPTFLRRKMA